LQPQPLLLGSNHAFVQFEDAPKEDSIPLDDSRLGCKKHQACAVRYSLRGMTAHGTYTGTVELFSDCGKEGSVAVSGLFDGPVFQPSLTSDALKNGRLEVDATDNRAFTVTVNVPVGNPLRTYKINLAGATRLEAKSCGWWSDASCKTDTGPIAANFYPSEFQIDAGGSRSVIVSLPADLPVGTYQGFVRVTDSSDANLASDTTFWVRKTASADTRRLKLLVWVALGAILSVLINNIFPLNRDKQDQLERLRAERTRLATCTAIGWDLKAALTSEFRRLWLLIDTISVLDSQKDTLLASATQSLTEFSKRTDLAQRINGVRSEAALRLLPIRSQLLVDGHLDDAEDALAQADTASAEGRIAAATQGVQTAPVASSLAADLAQNIAKLARERGKAPAGLTRPDEIQKRIDQLQLDSAALPTMSMRELLAVERDYYIADTWTDVVEFGVTSNQIDLQPIGKPLLESLIAAPTDSQTQQLVKLIEADVSPMRLATALKNGASEIVCDDRPQYFDLIDFRFKFTYAACASLPAAQGILSYSWRFDDETTSPDAGVSCKHFFLPPRIGSRLRSFWKRERNQTLHTKTVTLSVAHPVWGEKQDFTKTLQLRAHSNGVSSLRVMQMATFLITTAVAVLAAFGAQYTQSLPTTIDWSAAVTGFLFGFGIDQLRNRTAGK
jgi:hypothetical protein